MKTIKHLAKPVVKRLNDICSKGSFKDSIIRLRNKWHIYSLAGSIEEGEKYWRNMCEEDRHAKDYHDRYDKGTTKHQKLKKDLECLCQQADVGLPTEMWTTLYHVLLCLDLENMNEEILLELPALPSLLRISIAPSYLNPIEEHRIYLDVTFASKKDVHDIWKSVRYWQKNIRPRYIEDGTLPDLLKDIKDGRPYGIDEELALDVYRLRFEEKLTWAKIGKKYYWPLQRDSYGNLNQCSTARYYAKRGEQLKQIK